MSNSKRHNQGPGPVTNRLTAYDAAQRPSRNGDGKAPAGDKRPVGKPSSGKRKSLRDFVKLPGYLMRLPQVSGKARLVLAFLLDSIGDNDFAWPSLRTIAKGCGVSVTGLRKIITRLEELRLLIVELDTRKQLNYYKVGPGLVRLRKAWVRLHEQWQQSADGRIDGRRPADVWARRADKIMKALSDKGKT
jgi:hypothetical protein